MTFHSPTYGKQTFDQMIDGIVNFVTADSANGYSLMVGSDRKCPPIPRSSPRSSCTATATAPIFLVGDGEAALPDLARTHLAGSDLLDLGRQSIVEELAEREIESRNIEIHVDIGENGPTKALIQEITGYVRSNGFAVYIKPQACAASAVADRLT